MATARRMVMSSIESVLSEVKMGNRGQTMLCTMKRNNQQQSYEKEIGLALFPLCLQYNR